MPQGEVMNITTRKYLKENEIPLEIQKSLDFSMYEFSGFSISKPVDISLTLKPGKNFAELSLYIQAQVETSCARCCDPVSEKHIIESNFMIREEDLQDNMAELPFMQNGDLELEEVIYQELLTSFPTIFLCSEECEGLCQKCGKKVKDCTCVHEPEIDPRLQVLRDLLQED